MPKAVLEKEDNAVNTVCPGVYGYRYIDSTRTLVEEMVTQEGTVLTQACVLAALVGQHGAGWLSLS